jgi:hypothetical protein
VNETAVLAIKELGISLATPAVAGLLEAETIFVAADDTRQTSGFRQVGDMLEYTVQLNVVVRFLLHNSKNFIYSENF